MRYIISCLALATSLALGFSSVSIANDADTAKIKELKVKCSKGDQNACTELEFLSD